MSSLSIRRVEFVDLTCHVYGLGIRKPSCTKAGRLSLYLQFSLFGRYAAQFGCLLVGERHVPETNLGRGDGFLFAIVVGKEECAGGQLPVQVVGVVFFAGAYLSAVNVEGRPVRCFHDEDDTIPLIVIDLTVITERAAQSNLVLVEDYTK